MLSSVALVLCECKGHHQVIKNSFLRVWQYCAPCSLLKVSCCIAPVYCCAGEHERVNAFTRLTSWHALSRQGASKLTRDDIERVFALYDRVSTLQGMCALVDPEKRGRSNVTSSCNVCFCMVWASPFARVVNFVRCHL